ncbi:hypothetical protein QFC22_006145 [Naganishia vaughanmartiniae]|uniref:Uncharacterized protein n=1 Tax=Naganishia vaughanmartiniae TaxID=1424756 RepID=A0ACC2WMT7_9TREE|nr:hypothetical protein QFC22_006145 [Naganishia vaughanmartiniae]
MSYLATHLTYQFLPPLLSGVLANIIDSYVSRSSLGKKRRVAGAVGRGKESQGRNSTLGRGKRWLKNVGIEWRDGPVGSDGWRRNRVLSHALIIIAYLVYLTTHSLLTHLTNPTLYSLLTITPQTPENGIKSAWRGLSRLYHPDKLGKGAAAEDGMWVLMREGYEVLMDPTARMAYDRFGPKSIGWTHATTIRDYALKGLEDMAVWYGITIGVQILLAYCRPEMRAGKWIRFYLLAALATAELALLFSPTSSPIHRLTQTIAPNTLPFQWIAFLREQWTIISLAITQLYPLFFSRAVDVKGEGEAAVKSVFGIGKEDALGLRGAVQRLGLLAQEMEVGNVITFDSRRRVLVGAAEGAEFEQEVGKTNKEGERLVRLLKKEMENHDIQMKLANSPVGAPLWKQAREARVGQAVNTA